MGGAEEKIPFPNGEIVALTYKKDEMMRNRFGQKQENRGMVATVPRFAFFWSLQAVPAYLFGNTN